MNQFFFIIAFFLLTQIASAAQGAKILGVSVTEGKITVKYSGGVVKTRYFSLKGSDPDTERFIVDFENAELTTTAISGQSNVAPSSVRIGQFTVKPLVTRLVVTGPKEHVGTFRVGGPGNGSTITINYQKAPAKKEETKPTPEVTKKETKTEEKEIKTVKKEEEKSIEEPENTPNEPGTINITGSSPSKIVVTDKEAIKYKIFRLHAPERLIVDLYNWDAQKALPKKNSSDLIVSIRSGKPEAKGNIARFVFDLTQKGISFEDKLSTDKKVLTVTLNALVSESMQENLKELRKVREGLKVVLDAGHGGYDAGAIYGGIEEKDVTLSITKMMRDMLTASRVQVVMTRRDDQFISLEERVNITRKNKPDLFVSVHCNALQSSSAIKGIETYYFTPQSRPLASKLHKNLTAKTKSPNRGVRKARFVVIRETAIPSVLVETGYLSNPTERKNLTSKDYQRTIARSLAEGIIDYLSDTKVTHTSTKKSKKR